MNFKFQTGIAAALLLCWNRVDAQPTNRPAARPAQKVYPIDLPTALRLAGAQNLDVSIARERLNEARANQEVARNQFFPWISPGVAYRRHDDNIQNVEGRILDIHKQSYTVGGTITAQVDLGDAIYKSLAARQLVTAADFALESRVQRSVYAAAVGYFDLAKARASVLIAEDALKNSQGYSRQLQDAADAGIAFRGDVFRATVQSEKNQLALRQAIELQRVAAARLAQTVHLDPAVELVPEAVDLAPLTLTDPRAALDGLVAQALAWRPELRQGEAETSAARKANAGAIFGPLVPALGAQAFLGGLGGGQNGRIGDFGESEDYLVGLSWRIGPGGIFDRSRIRASEARLKISLLEVEKLREDITRQVVESHAQVHSLSDQMETAKKALTAAEQTLKLTRERKEYAVGAVLENIQAEQELTRARNDFLNAVAEFNKAQYSLSRAIGALSSAAPKP